MPVLCFDTNGQMSEGNNWKRHYKLLKDYQREFLVTFKNKKVLGLLSSLE